MSRDLRWVSAENFFVSRCGRVRFSFRGFSPVHPRARCCRCGRRPDGSGRLYVVCDPRGETLEYGVDCWPRRLLPALEKAIDLEADPERKRLMEENRNAFCGFAVRSSDAQEELVWTIDELPELVDAVDFEVGPPEVLLRVTTDEALRLLRGIPHAKCRGAISRHWVVDRDGAVASRSVDWLFCWGKTGMNSPLAAAEARRVFDAVFDVSFREYNDLVDHEEARRTRYCR